MSEKVPSGARPIPTCRRNLKVRRPEGLFLRTNLP